MGGFDGVVLDLDDVHGVIGDQQGGARTGMVSMCSRMRPFRGLGSSVGSSSPGVRLCSRTLAVVSASRLPFSSRTASVAPECRRAMFVQIVVANFTQPFLRFVVSDTSPSVRGSAILRPQVSSSVWHRTSVQDAACG